MTKTAPSYESAAESDRTDGARSTLLTMVCAAAAIAYVQRSGISAAAGVMQNDLGMDKERFGAVMSIWSLGYALAQIPSGWLADRWGSQRTLALYAVLWSVITGFMALARGYPSSLLIWALMGVAQAGLVPCAARAIRKAFPDARRASATGMFASCMGVGQAVAPALTVLLLTVMNWRWVFILFGLPGLAWGVVFYIWLREERESPAGLRILHSGTLAQPSASHLTAPPWKVMLGSGSIWLLCLQQFLRAAAMIFFITWFPTFLQESRHVTLMKSGILSAMANVGVVVGSLVGGVVSDKVLEMTGSRRLSRQGIAVVGMTACAILIVIAYYISNTTLAVAVISAGAFCGTFGGVSAYTVAMDVGGKRVATVFSVMNMCGNIGATPFPLAIGWLVNKTGNWDLVLFIFAAIFAVDAVCWSILNPKRPLFEE